MKHFVIFTVCLLFVLLSFNPAISALYRCGANQEYKNGQCVCKAGYKMEDGICVNDCKNGMQFISGRCQCPPDMYWNRNLQKCSPKYHQGS